MYKDQKEALRRLEAELLNEEYTQEKTLDEELDEAYELLGEPREDAEYLYRNYSNGYGRGEQSQDSVDTDADLEEFPEEPEEEKPTKGVQGLITLALVELAGIFAVLAYWVIRYL